MTRIGGRETEEWLARHIKLIELSPRKQGYSPSTGSHAVTEERVHALAEAAEQTAEAIEAMDLEKLARGVTGSFEAQLSMFPAMITETGKGFDILNRYRENIKACKVTGAGGGGYLMVVVSDKDIHTSGNTFVDIGIRGV